MTSLNQGAKEFIPSWFKPKPAQPESETSAKTQVKPAAKPTAKPSPPKPNEGFSPHNTVPLLEGTQAPRGLSADSKWTRPMPNAARPSALEPSATGRSQGAASRSPPQVARGTKPPLPIPSIDDTLQMMGATAGSSDSSFSMLQQHSREEADEISRRSTLNAGATVFVPKSTIRRGTQLSTSPPPRPPVESERPAASKPGQLEGCLSDTWHLYYIDRRESAAHGGTQNFDPYLVYTFDDLTTFWRVFNNIPTATRSAVGSTFFLFRDGIDPRWEDPRNESGGAETIKFNSSHSSEKIDRVWLRFCCCAVGESWASEVASKVTGVVLKHRERTITLQIWTTDRVEKMPTEVRKLTEDPITFSEYLSHKQMAEHAAKAEAEAKAAGITNKPSGKKKRKA